MGILNGIERFLNGSKIRHSDMKHALPWKPVKCIVILSFKLPPVQLYGKAILMEKLSHLFIHTFWAHEKRFMK